uniref:Protein hunchback n=2 Tax=Schistocephalus solidus TaxID=70667 RepID=A0A0X3PPC3_SCHSO
MSELSSVTYCQTLSNGGNTASKQKNCSPFKLLSPSSHSSPLGLANSYVKCEPQQLEYMSSGQSNTRDKGAPFNPSACPRSEDSSLHLVDTRRSTVTSDETLQPICICSSPPACLNVSKSACLSLTVNPLPAAADLLQPISSPSMPTSGQGTVQRIFKEAICCSQKRTAKMAYPLPLGSGTLHSVSSFALHSHNSSEDGETGSSGSQRTADSIQDLSQFRLTPGLRPAFAEECHTGSLELSVDAHRAMESSTSTPPSEGVASYLQDIKTEIESEGSVSKSPPSLWAATPIYGIASPGDNASWKVLRLSDGKGTADEDGFSFSNSTGQFVEKQSLHQVEMFTDSVKPDKEGIYFCHLCEFTGKKRFEFQTHLRSHYDFHCQICDYTSRTEGRLKRHMKDFHSEVPPENFSGKIAKLSKPKFQKCKQCDFIAETKTDYWTHQRLHIKEERQLDCPHCPFVTEYKHHLEYHIRNHLGSKPFKCSKCNYECVNKSMLNSHMKSHTNIYQYRCADCNYATKYCHSLKLHSNKHGHHPAMVLNVDGSLPEGGCGTTDLRTANEHLSDHCLTENTSLPTSPSIRQFTLSPNPQRDRSPLFRSFQPEPRLLSPYELNSFEKAFQTFLPPPPALSEAPPCRTSFTPPQSSWLPTAGLPTPLSGLSPSMSFLSPGLPLNFPPTPTAVAAMAAFMLSAQQHAFSSMESLMNQDHLKRKAREEGTNRREMSFRSMSQLAKGELNDPVWALDAWQDCVHGSSPLLSPTTAMARNESTLRPQLHSTILTLDCSGNSAMNACDGVLDLSSRGVQRMDVIEETEAKIKTEKEKPGVFSSRIQLCDLPYQESTPRPPENALYGDQFSVPKESECPYCEIIFKNRTLYELHMRFHNPQNPFACNQCGVQSRSQIEFFTHLSEKEHNSQ